MSDPIYPTDRSLLSNPARLRAYLRVICNRNKACLPYHEAKEALFKLVQCKSLYGDNVVITDIHTPNINVEHIVPQSFFNKREPMRGDLHHLYPANDKLNEWRSNYMFGELAGESDECEHTADRFEPQNFSKGNIARAIAYFVTTYDMVDLKRVICPDTLVLWNIIDPVDDDERHRNTEICKIQGNINPYIVHPELCTYAFMDYIKGDVKGTIDGVDYHFKREDLLPPRTPAPIT